MKKKLRYKKAPETGELSALDLMEETFYLFRLHGAKILPIYFLGTIPFALGLLYFINDMSRGLTAGTVRAALLITVLFFIKNVIQTVYCRQVLDIMHLRTGEGVTWRDLLRILIIQNLIQPFGLFLQMISAVMMFALPYTTAFLHSFHLLVFERDANFKEMLRRAFQQATYRSRQNYYLTGLLTIFGFMIMLNIIVIIILVPWFLETFLDIRTVFSLVRGPLLLLRLIFNTTFWSIVLVITYIILDPVIKTAYTIRYFYGRSVTTGSDIMSDFIRVLGKRAVMLLLPLLLGFAFWPAELAGAPSGQAGQEIATDQAGVDAGELMDAIEKVLKQREYQWRLGKQRKERKSYGFFPTMLESFFKWLQERMAKLEAWLDKYLRPKDRSSGDWSFARLLAWFQENLLWLSLFVLGVILVVILLIYLRQRRKRVVSAQALDDVAAAVPDLNDEQLSPDELEESEWLRLAEEFMEKGEYRLALRAFFLAGISVLAKKNVLTVARYKTNRDYFRELQRRYHYHPQSVAAFQANLLTFEMVWYGEREVNRRMLKKFNHNFEKICR